MGYDWNFQVIVPYWHAFLHGVLVSVELTAYCSAIGTALGFALAFALRARYVGVVVTLVNDMLRAVPLLVLLFFFYYFPYKQVLGVQAPSAFWAATAALTLAQTNFTAEIVRAAMDRVPTRILLGARALGLTERDVWWHVTMPSVFRQTLPTLAAFYIGNLKLSSLASVIGAEEVVYVARLSVSQTFRTLEAWVVVSLIYIALVLPCTIALRQLENSEWVRRWQ
jgi:polar amino acid transport system permease protein